jgi:ABC-type glutathione transport system ATPase component
VNVVRRRPAGRQREGVDRRATRLCGADEKRQENLGVLYIAHDLATARHFSGEIMVLYQGSVVESDPAADVILRPQHPRTWAPAT